jgi:uncharacterized protein (DUF2336 family)
MTAQSTMIDEVEDAVLRGTPERRADLLARITDLFILGSSQFSEDHVALFDDVIGRLAAEIEAAARAVLANRLAAVANAPPNVMRRLAFDDAIDVAGPVLTHCSRIDDAALIDNAKAKSQPHLLAISRRVSLSEAVTDVLVERGDQEVVQSTAENRGAPFSEFGYTTLVQRAEGDDRLALAVGSRPEIPRHHFLKVLAKASQLVQNRLKETNPQAIGDIKSVVAEVAGRIQARAGANSRDYVCAHAAVETLKQSSQLGEPALEAFAKSGKFEETTAALAALCDLPINAVETAMVQDRCELVLILAKSIGLSWRTAKAILLLRAGTHGMPAQELEQQLKGYELLKTATAQQVVRFQRSRARRSA